MREILLCGCAASLCLSACGGGGAQAPPGAGDWFVDRAADLGLDFVHVNGMSGRFLIPEIMGPGVALLDYDGDGDLDVYLVQGGSLSLGQESTPAAEDAEGGPAPRGDGLSDRLFRNDLTVAADGARSLRFTDVTRQAGIEARGYGMGVAAGDVNNDGWVDLYLTKFDAPNQLLLNGGDGTFDDVSARSGTDHRSWSVSAAFLDVDRDGWLDLYVANYLRYGASGSTACVGPSGAPGYCTPDAYPPVADRLYLNRRDGTFADINNSSGIAREFGPGLGVATADYDGDGWIDIYVANDGMENQLWRNRHDRTFENTALLAGVALPLTAKAEASMGVDAGDFDDDGDEDLFMTELTGEGGNLFVNDGTGLFSDQSGPSALGPGTLAYTGFGTAWMDFDGDGRLDVLSVNGTVQFIERLRQAGDPFPLHQPKLLFRNLGDGRFEDVTGQAGAAFRTSEVGRGVAVGDVDNDGDVDVLVGTNNGRPQLLLNEATGAHGWFGLRLVGEGGRDMLGARVEIVGRDGGSRWRRVRTDGSYASASDPRVLVSLGDGTGPVGARVTWPHGAIEYWPEVPVGRYTTLVEGTAP